LPFGEIQVTDSGLSQHVHDEDGDFIQDFVPVLRRFTLLDFVSA
jgi:hypothetical protein